MAEPLHDEDYYGPLGPAELVYYQAPGRDGSQLLAEHYREDGLDVIWDNHDATRSTDPDAVAHRMAIITDSKRNTYFLSGNTLYDLGASKAKNRPVGEQYDATYTMPDLQIGEEADFTNGNRVTGVIIATETVKPGDPMLLGAHERRGNPFLSAFASIQELSRSPQPDTGEERRYRTTRTGVAPMDPATRKSNLMKYFPKDGIIDRDRVTVRHPDMPNRLITAASMIDWEEGTADLPIYLRGRDGGIISPRVVATEANVYKPRRMEALAMHIGEIAFLGKSAVHELPGLRNLHERRLRRAHDRAEEYWAEQPVELRPPEWAHLPPPHKPKKL